KRLESVFGYSSACVPSILSGAWPVEHRNWSYFVYDPVNSPFKSLRCLRWLPAAVTSRRIFRRWLSKFVKAQLSFRGYFDLYNVPFKHISLYDFTEKKSPLQPHGMNEGTNVFDYLEQRRIPYHVSDPGLTEEANLASLIHAIDHEEPNFAFLYWPALDGLLHSVGNQSPEIPAKLRSYERWIEKLLHTARGHYQEIKLYVFSDHGMANCDEVLDLKAQIETLPLRMPEDYVVVYDSTMARFWIFNDRARWLLTECLGKVPQGRIVPDAELGRLGALFPDRYFGELVFLVKEGVLIVPSHMGERPIRGMHGYHPEEKQSYALLCTNQEQIPEQVTAIPHVYNLMVKEAENAQSCNEKPQAPSTTARAVQVPSAVQS
ncbi:MAG TPA: alkaline phosphatase family protein, partial [Candidatus Dormibacteraeota bacterium]|nr:alkaline phosphatase family protein [Candidatus Dormibacteraeota bacterium]